MVQGGTFYNEAVLRAFEKEMGVEVIRPDIAGLMGAYGAALYGLRQSSKAHRTASGMMSRQELEAFEQKVVSVKCGGCGNHCQLTVNTFADGRKYISGNRCDKPVTGKSADNSLNLYAYKQELLASYKPVPGKRGSIGIPLCLASTSCCPSGGPSGPSWALRCTPARCPAAGCIWPDRPPSPAIRPASRQS